MNSELLVMLAEYPFDPYLNIAFDEALLIMARRGYVKTPILRIWRNSPSIVIGRSCNIELEVNLDVARKLDIPIVRRISGGGAVYHDLGNINYTLVVTVDHRPSIEFIYGYLLKGILNMLRRLGLNPRVENDTDVVVGDCKVSGNSAVIRRELVLLHGTLLIDADLDVMCQVLRPNPQIMRRYVNYRYKYRVTNLSCILGEDVNPSEIAAMLIEEYSNLLNSRPRIRVPDKELLLLSYELANAKYRSYEWIFRGIDRCSQIELSSLITEKIKRICICDLLSVQAY